MGEILERLPLPTFDGWRLPYEGMSLRSRARSVIHRYRRKPAGPAEDHGRENYVISFDCEFHDDAGYDPPLFPDTLDALRSLYNRRAVGLLMIPHIGEVQAKIDEWDESLRGNIVSGGRARIGFTETEIGFQGVLANNVDASSLQALSADWDARVEELDPDDRVDIFDAISDAADQVLAVRDQILLHGELAQSRVQLLLNLIQQADYTVSLFQDADNWELLYSMKALKVAAQDLLTRPAYEQGQPAHHIVERKSTVMDVAVKIYGDANRSADLLALNVFPDAMAIPAGTRVLYLRS